MNTVVFFFLIPKIRLNQIFEKPTTPIMFINIKNIVVRGKDHSNPVTKLNSTKNLTVPGSPTKHNCIKIIITAKLGHKFKIPCTSTILRDPNRRYTQSTT